MIGVLARCKTEADGSQTVRPVPMSWWLSMPVQEQLEDQMCADYNRRDFAEVVQSLQEQQPTFAEVGYDPSRLKAAFEGQIAELDIKIRAFCATTNDTKARVRAPVSPDRQRRLSRHRVGRARRAHVQAG